jgi:hypothetical protein
MSDATDVRRAWARANDPLDVFDVVTRLAPRSPDADTALTRALHDALPTPADRWMAERLLEGRLGVTSGLPSLEVPPAPIPVHFLRGASAERVLVLSGVHGSEPQGMEIVRLLVRQLDRLRQRGTRPAVNVLVVPVLFPDNARVGPHGRREGTIPTNRNFPTDGRALADTGTDEEGRPLDAQGRRILPENVLLMQVLERFRPRHVVSVHGTQYPRRAGLFSDPYRPGPAGLPSSTEAERRTRIDERRAVEAAEEVARRTDGLEALRRARRQIEHQQAEEDHRPATVAPIEAHPAVAGNRLGAGDTAEWSGEVADGVSLGTYAPARGIGVFTIEPAINRASAAYPVPDLDPGVSPDVRRRELRAYATAIRTVLLRAGTSTDPAD